MLARIGKAGLLLVAVALPCRGQVTRRVSVDSHGVEGNDLSFQPAISSDGRFVAFESVADNLVPGDTNGGGDVFVYDRWSGSMERVSVRSDGMQADYYSGEPALSSDGRFVAFTSAATNLVPGDTNDYDDVFVRDRVRGTTERVSIATDGAQGNSYSKVPSISADGRFVAFASVASNLSPGDTNGTYDVFVHDRLSGVTTQVSVSSAGEAGNAASGDPSLSADARYVTFFGFASNLVPGDTNGVPDVFVHDSRSHATTRVSVATGGAQGGGASVQSTISSDGRFVAFISVAADLVPGDTNGVSDVFVHDRRDGTTIRVSVDSDGGQGNGFSRPPAISSDGRWIAFVSNATNLVPGDTNGFEDAFLHDLERGITVRASLASDGTQGNWDCGDTLAISGDGRLVAFYGGASTYVPGDTNGTTDVFVRDVHAAGFTSSCDPGRGGVLACPCANPPAGSGRGCDNFAATGGAVLSASGIAYLSQDELVFTANALRPGALSILLQGNATIPSGAVIGLGVRCVGGSILRRLYTRTAIGGLITVPAAAAGDPTVSERSAQKGDAIRAGQSRWYLVYYRDEPPASGCAAASGFNATQTGRVEWSL